MSAEDFWIASLKPWTFDLKPVCYKQNATSEEPLFFLMATDPHGLTLTLISSFFYL